MKRIHYYVFCFDRELIVDVKEEDADFAEEIMEDAYLGWHGDADDADGFCCEEYILFKLREAGVYFKECEEEYEDE